MSKQAKASKQQDVSSWTPTGTSIHAATVALYRAHALHEVSAQTAEFVYRPILEQAFKMVCLVDTTEPAERAKDCLEALESSVVDTLAAIAVSAEKMLPEYRAHGGEGLEREGDKLVGPQVILKVVKGTRKNPCTLKTLRGGGLRAVLSYFRTCMTVMPIGAFRAIDNPINSYTWKKLAGRIRENSGRWDAAMLSDEWKAPEKEPEKPKKPETPAEVVAGLPEVFFDAVTPLNDERAAQWLNSFAARFMAADEFRRGEVAEMADAILSRKVTEAAEEPAEAEAATA